MVNNSEWTFHVPRVSRAVPHFKLACAFWLFHSFSLKWRKYRTPSINKSWLSWPYVSEAYLLFLKTLFVYMLPLAIPVTDDAELHCSVSSLPKFHSVGVLVIQKFAVNIFIWSGKYFPVTPWFFTVTVFKPILMTILFLVSFIIYGL